MINFLNGLKVVLGLLVVCGALLMQSCLEGTVVGNELLNQDLQVVGFTDTFGIRAYTRTEDSVLVYSEDNGGQIIRHTLGNLDDPFFGKASSIVSSQVFLNGVGTDMLNYQIDSVVIALSYLGDQCYGDLDATLSVDAYRVNEDLDLSRDYYSTDEIAREGIPSGGLQDFVAQPFDSLTLTRPGDTSIVRPQLRMHMTQSFIQDMLAQPEGVFQTQDSLETWWKGLQFEMPQGDNTMLTFNLNDAQSGVFVYYSSADSTINRTYQFIFQNPSFFEVRQVQIAKFENDYSGSVVGSFIDNEERSDSLIFVQSMSGVNTEFEFIGLEDATGVVVNKAVLEVYSAVIPEDDQTLYPVVERIQTRVLNSDSVLVNSRDIILALSIQSIDAFGGEPEMLTDGLYRYTMDATAVVQDILSGRIENRIFLSSYLKPNQPHRVILNGPGHSEYPARLKIAFTRTE